MAEPKVESTGYGFIWVFIIVIVAMWAFNEGPQASNRDAAGNYQAPSTLEGIQQEVTRIDRETSQLKSDVAAANKVGEKSDLYQYLSINQAYLWSENPSFEYDAISLSSNAPKRVLISGMRIKSGITGRGALIPRAVYRPDFSNPNYDDPVYLNPGDTAYIISGKSPLGYSFRVNKCSGYATQFNTFSPSLSYECPLPASEDLPNFTANKRNQCLNYIQSIPSCFMPVNDVPSLEIGPDCVQYVTTKINYNSCVATHKLEPDFYKGVWYLYLRQDETLWQNQREQIKLIDQNGKTSAYYETY